MFKHTFSLSLDEEAMKALDAMRGKGESRTACISRMLKAIAAWTNEQTAELAASSIPKPSIVSSMLETVAVSPIPKGSIDAPPRSTVVGSEALAKALGEFDLPFKPNYDAEWTVAADKVKTIGDKVLSRFCEHGAAPGFCKISTCKGAKK